jgi:HEPN domain-containing protein
MNALAAEWVEKVEADFATAGRELRARVHPNWDAVCFHAQQTAEKYLKAYLQQHGSAPPRSHSLIDLLQFCQQIDLSFGVQRDALVLLDRYAVAYRYPGSTASRTEARRAHRAIAAVRAFARQKLVLA